MKGTHQLHGDAVPADGSAGLDAVVPARERTEPVPPPATAWSNVVPFVRPRADVPPPDVAPTVVVNAAERPAPDLPAGDTRAWLPALVVVSLLAHAGLYLIANREPEPMASVSLEAISVEIVVGPNSAPTQADAQPVEPEKTVTQAAPEQTVTPAPQQPPPPETAQAPPPPEISNAPPPEQQQAPPPPETTAVPPEQTQPAPQPEQTPPRVEPQSVAPVPPPKPEPPKQVAKPEPPKPPVKPAPKHETKSKPAPKHEATPKTAPKTAPKRETTRRETPGQRSNASNGGRAGSPVNDANYRGLVAAHLARYKRFPPEAQKSGAQGSASVRFTVSGSGAVSSVSLVRGTGVAALDQEAVAMVHRASPFPAPPNGRAVSFTVPVSYKMR